MSERLCLYYCTVHFSPVLYCTVQEREAVPVLPAGAGGAGEGPGGQAEGLPTSGAHAGEDDLISEGCQDT